jgi:hypothetical protein
MGMCELPRSVPLELGLQLGPALAVAHEQLDVARHVPLERVVVVEPSELELVGQLLGDGRPLLLEVADAVGGDAEHLQDVRHAAAVALRQLRPEAGGLVPVLARVALLEALATASSRELGL